MSSIPDSVQKVPSNVIQIKRKHPFLTFLTGVGIIIFLAYGGLHFFLVERTEKLIQKNEELALDITNLKLFQEQSARLLRLEQVLLSNAYIKEQIGQDNIAQFAFKILTTADMYKEDGLTPALLLGLIEVESNFQTKVISESGAYGLMQVMRSTATPYLRARNREWSDVIMFDPMVNITIGIDVLVDMHRMFLARGMEKKDEWTLSLICYNRGEGSVRDAINRKNPLYLDYAVKVKMAARKWDALGL